jgi:hypothetical protein
MKNVSRVLKDSRGLDVDLKWDVAFDHAAEFVVGVGVAPSRAADRGFN